MKKPISILLAAFIVLLPLSAWLVGGIFGRQEVVLLACVVLLAALFSYILFQIICKTQISVSFTVLDLSVFLFLLYGLANIVFVRHFNISLFVVYKWFAVFCAYLLCRVILHKNILMYALVLSGLVQSAIAILQKFYVLGNNNIFFDVTGSFSNPGRLGGFLAVAFVAAFCLLRNAVKNKSLKQILLLSVSLVFLFYALVLADSRAAFVAVFCGVAVYFFPFVRKIFIKHKIVFTSIFLAIIIFGGLLLFNYRQGSANSRLLIWRVSADMISDKPVFGHGITSFDEKYMHCQAAYFNENPNSKFIAVADNVAYVYNEFLHVSVEMGILGLMFLLLIFYCAFFSKKQQSQKAVLAVLLGFSMFSYPTEIFILLFLFAIILSCTNTKKLYEINLSRYWMIICCFIVVCACILTLKTELYLTNASHKFTQLHENEKQTKEYILKHYKRLKYEHEFCRIYTNWLMKNPSEKEIFNVLELFPSSENYCIFGEYYVEKEMYEKAEECFNISANMLPNRILPNYNLFKLYQNLGDEENTMRMAKKILSQHIKIENTQTIRIQFEVEKYLQANSL
ncbi:MAG: O-antigen ligase family protein [Prevotellaceae bacterium]|jgi:O-antigen ligase|nr:O-antigen ligase family protein [Prevotellaceae bacterium]